MEKEEEHINEELKNVSRSFPKKEPKDVPRDYFDAFPDRILNRWAIEQSYKPNRKLQWRNVIGIAALITGLIISGLWLLTPSSSTNATEITSAEAYQFIHENIEEFEDLLESNEIYSADENVNIPKEEIEEYLIEETDGSDPEDLF